MGAELMAATFIETRDLPMVDGPDGRGMIAEILNPELCGAKNVRALLRSLRAGERLEARSDERTHQVLYVMDGAGTVTLAARDYSVGKGAGIYLGPADEAVIRHAGDAPLRLLHLLVPRGGGAASA